MKKIVASVGLVALGASGLQAASVPGITTDLNKPWSIAATLRGFYDDNFNSAPNDVSLNGWDRESFGFEISPSIQLVLPMEQTSLTAGYSYSYKWYENDFLNSDDNDDSVHMFNLGLAHAFSERYQVSVKDSFVIGQEPDILRAGNAMETYQRIPGDNLRNFGSIDFDGKINPTLGWQLGYANSWYNYADDDAVYNTSGGFVFGTTPSTSGLLDRIEHTPHLDLKWQLQPETVGVVGYQYRGIDYTGDEDIAGNDFVGYSQSDIRNSRSHYGYIGLDHTFRPDLTGSIRLGALHTDYYNDDNQDSDVTPYILASLKYTYAEESYFEFGLTHDKNATDLLGNTADGFTMDQDSTVVFLNVNHKLASKLYGSLMGQVQYSEFNGGTYDNDAEWFYMVGLNLEYRFTHNLGAHIGYNFDALDSDIENRNLDRNRVYLGVTARY